MAEINHQRKISPLEEKLKRFIGAYAILVESPQVDKKLQPTGKYKTFLYAMRQADEKNKDNDSMLLAELPRLLGSTTNYVIPHSKTLLQTPEGETCAYMLACEIPDMDTFNKSHFNLAKAKISITPEELDKHIGQLEELGGQLQRLIANRYDLDGIKKWHEQLQERDPAKAALAYSLIRAVPVGSAEMEMRQLPPAEIKTPNVHVSLESGGFEIATKYDSKLKPVLAPIDEVANEFGLSDDTAKRVEAHFMGLPVGAQEFPREGGAKQR